MNDFGRTCATVTRATSCRATTDRPIDRAIARSRWCREARCVNDANDEDDDGWMRAREVIATGWVDGCAGWMID